MKLAVEWFANRISHGGLVSKKQFNELLEQAKAIEEDGKHESYLYGHEVGYKKAEEKQIEQRKEDFREGWHGNKHKDWNCEYYLQQHLTNQFKQQEQ